MLMNSYIQLASAIPILITISVLGLTQGSVTATTFADSPMAERLVDPATTAQDSTSRLARSIGPMAAPPPTSPIAPPVAPPLAQLAAAESEALYSLPHIFTQILYDDDSGHIWGWDPDNTVTTFLIEEPLIDPLSSTVLVNTHVFNFVVCGVDYLTYGYFEVTCDRPPAEGGELHYTVINVEPLPIPGPEISSELTQRYENATEGVQVAELPSGAQQNSTSQDRLTRYQ
jgi:hypothetical protein